MSININHPNDDISSTNGDAPTLGGGRPSVNVMSTATSTANYYAKLATLTYPGTSNVSASLSFILTPKNASLYHPPVIVSLVALQGASGLSTSSKINIISNNGTAIAYNDLFLVTSAATNGTDIELYMQSIIAAAYDVQLLNSSFDTGVSISSWNDGATWSVTDPTIAAATSVTSDWGGSGQLTDSSGFANGWAGTAYYEKDLTGTNLIKLSISTVGTTTNGTTIYTVASGFRPSLEHRKSLTAVGVTAGHAGFVLASGGGGGTFLIYDYVPGGLSIQTEWFSYKARF